MCNDIKLLLTNGYEIHRRNIHRAANSNIWLNEAFTAGADLPRPVSEEPAQYYFLLVPLYHPRPASPRRRNRRSGPWNSPNLSGCSSVLQRWHDHDHSRAPNPNPESALPPLHPKTAPPPEDPTQSEYSDGWKQWHWGRQRWRRPAQVCVSKSVRAWR